jgi:uncharacterized protein (DUF924 family)
MSITPADVVGFWKAAGPGKWFKKSPAFDAEITARFMEAHFAASRGEYAAWAATPDGALALLLLLDQFPRNMFRGSAHSFATDPLARSIAEAALAAGHDRVEAQDMRGFFYLPFEHSERIEDQDRSVELTAWDPELHKWALIHHDIISRFGRFPHRNTALGRTTTAEEQAFLDSGGFAG